MRGPATMEQDRPGDCAGQAADARGDPVAIRRLMLSAFRSYAQLRLDVDPAAPIVVLTGENGAGKTNVLEAISYLAPGRGLRGAALGDVQCRQAPAANTGPWAVSAQVQKGGGGEPFQVGTGLDADSGRRTVRLDGETHASTAVLGQHWSLLWLTPQMDRLFTEAPSGRRKFLDRLVLALVPDHASQISAYERAMRERNRLLSEDDWRRRDSWLGAIEARLAAHASAVALARVDALTALAPVLADMAVPGFPEPVVTLEGAVEERLLAGDFASDVEADLRAQLADMRPLDAATGRQQAGVHRSDLVVFYRAKDMPAALCSTGEQKALLVSLVLGQAALVQAKSGSAPLLLLDEVAAHLDAARRRALVERLNQLGSQCWLTGTDATIFDAIARDAGTAMNHYQVSDGTITVRAPGASS